MPDAVYPGSLDPITFGHIGAIRDTAAGFGRVTVAIGVNPAKKYLFSLAEREALARHALIGIDGVSVTAFSGLLVHFLVRNNLDVVVRGVRNGVDLDDAILQEMIGWQQTLAKDIKAFYVPARPGHAFVSSTALKAVLKEQGDATHLAPLSTIHATQARMMGQYFYGVTGISGSGKSNICRQFAAIAARRNIPLLHIDLDKIGHDILSDAQDPLYQKTRLKIEHAFGADVLDENGFVIRKKLGKLVFGHPDKLKVLNEIMHEPVFFRMNDLLRGRKGIFLIDAALLAETGKSALVNNHMLVVSTKDADIAQRLLQRDQLTPEQIQRRVSSQFSTEAKIAMLQKNIEEASYGHLARLDNDDQLPQFGVEKAFDVMLGQIDLYGELRIVSFFKSLGILNAEESYSDLRQLYSGDDRFHHALSHIVDGLNKIPGFLSALEDPKAFILAWLFHDAVYDARKEDNEEQSAIILEKLCLHWGVDRQLILRAKLLVLVTQHDVIKADSSDEKYLADLDKSILGSPADEYALYEQNVRREYAWLSTKDWLAGRRQFLNSLSQPYFQTDYFSVHFGEQAEKNIKRSLFLLLNKE